MLTYLFSNRYSEQRVAIKLISKLSKNVLPKLFESMEHRNLLQQKRLMLLMMQIDSIESEIYLIRITERYPLLINTALYLMGFIKSNTIDQTLLSMFGKAKHQRLILKSLARVASPDAILFIWNQYFEGNTTIKQYALNLLIEIGEQGLAIITNQKDLSFKHKKMLIDVVSHIDTILETDYSKKYSI